MLGERGTLLFEKKLVIKMFLTKKKITKNKLEFG